MRRQNCEEEEEVIVLKGCKPLKTYYRGTPILQREITLRQILKGLFWAVILFMLIDYAMFILQ